MAPNLQAYHRIKRQLCQWLPNERITRLRNLALLIFGLQASGAIHLSLIVRKWPSRSQEVSLVNRLRRFLNNPAVEVQRWYRPLAQEVVNGFGGRQYRLILDCTKLGFGYRLMTVALAYKKRALPLAWSVHRGCKGHTTAADQIALLRQVAPLLPKRREVWVMGDTGFQSVPLLRWLTRQHWHFVIRQQGRITVRQPGQPWTKLNQFDLQPGQSRLLGWVRLTQTHNAGWFWLLLHWAEGEDEPWYLVSDRQGYRDLLRFYRTRMWIEEMYGDWKGHGFDLEATHLDDPDRLTRLVLAVCITFVWLITLGSYVVKRGWRKIVDVKSRRDKSYFRIGWDWVERARRLGDPLPLHFKPYF